MSTPSKKPERRTPRTKVDEDLVLLRTSDEGDSAFGSLLDISENGIGVVIEGSINLGDEVSVSLALGPAKKVLRCRAVVRHVRGNVKGFEFLDLNEEQLGILREACRAAGLI